GVTQRCRQTHTLRGTGWRQPPGDGYAVRLGHDGPRTALLPRLAVVSDELSSANKKGTTVLPCLLGADFLEQVPKKLVVDIVVILHLGCLDEGSQQPRAAISRCLFQVRIAHFDVVTKNLADPVSVSEILHGSVDVVRKVALRLTQVLDFSDFAVEPGLEDRVHDHVRAGIRRYGTDFDSHASFVADGDANHGAAIRGRCFELIRSFEMRVEPPKCIYARVQQQANVIAVGEQAIYELPAELAEFFFSFGIPKKILSTLVDGDVSVHAASVHTYHRFRQE